MMAGSGSPSGTGANSLGGGLVGTNSNSNGATS
jgi:hypothetical protein